MDLQTDPRVLEQRRLRPKEFWADERCRRCGVCCGSTDGDPCIHLKHDGVAYYCDIYEHRGGPQRTVNGTSFICVPIREVIERTGGYRGCAYLEPLPD